MEFLRTPDERFANLPAYDYEPNYINLLDGDARMHYVDVGDGDETLLCLHGEPTWSYLYRHIINDLKDRYRLIAPDMLGFGRSDKPTELDDHTYFLHHRTLFEFIDRLDLRRLTLVCQDWGGFLGLSLAMKHRERFDRLIIMNTGLPTGDIELGEGFQQWKEFAAQQGRNLQASQTVAMGTQTDIADEVLAAYDAPFPDASYRAGVAALPQIVPMNEHDPGAADLRQARGRLRNWHKPTLVMFSDSDAVTRGGDVFFRKLIPAARKQPEITIENGGHFLQEDQGETIAAQIHAFIERTPINRPAPQHENTVRIPSMSDILDDDELDDYAQTD